jgi:hypothetical protein
MALEAEQLIPVNLAAVAADAAESDKATATPSAVVADIKSLIGFTTTCPS